MGLLVSRATARGIRGRWLLFGMVLLLVPWLGLRYLGEMRAFLLEGQERAQMLAAAAVATVLHDRARFYAPLDEAGASREHGLYAFPLGGYIQVDGYATDWGGLLDRARRYGGAGALPTFQLLLGVREDVLYLLVRVQDERVVYRHPGFERLDTSDQVRLSLVDSTGEPRRFVLTTEGPGNVRIFEVGSDWRSALARYGTSAIRGSWQEREGGYDLEVRLPVTQLGTEPRLRLAVLDIDAPESRAPRGESATGHHPMPVIRRSADIAQVLGGFVPPDLRIWVVDRQRYVRAVAGLREEAAALIDALPPAYIGQALLGTPSVGRLQGPNGEELIVASHPIRAQGEPVGAVVLEQDSAAILALQRETFGRFAISTLAVLLLMIAALLGFSTWFAWRVRRLKNETVAAIGPQGRLLATSIDAERTALDDLGELSRSISATLERLARYMGFLERLPRTLRHEVHNPLNVVSTGLQNLAEESPAAAQSRYLASAQRATQRLTQILVGLTEAANLEEALRAAESTRFDLAHMASAYVEGCRQTYPDRRFIYEGPATGVFLDGSDLRIEQLLDKLMDNAVEVGPDQTPIQLRLEVDEGWALLSVLDEGPGLAEAMSGTNFAPFALGSGRPSNKGGAHLGIGLYVVQTIAMHHGGHLEAANRTDGAGARMTVWLPVAPASQ